MDRIYTNHRYGERRIHIEVDENEIADLLDDFTPTGDAFDATKKLHALLVLAARDFANDRRGDAHEAETSRT
ncbi:hypothetical protein AB0D78_28385 [Streptomyces avermitilis]|uniref:hypothetical protein n=1 Tax=Streptomyces avermitilis TaxID=33903 RepID=UPI0033EC0A62